MRLFRPACVRHLAFAEFRSFWTNPSGGLALLVFLVLAGFLFYNTVADYAASSAGSLSRGRFLNADLAVFSGGLANLGLVLLLVSPLTTMKAMAPYSQGGHLDLLTAWPLKPSEIVLAHFFSAFMILALMTVLSLLPFGIILFMGVGSAAVLLTSLAGFFLLIAAYTAIGLALASMTSSPLAAALTALGVLTFRWTLGLAAP
ncbi:MAG: ABC transporter permease, partial [Deltaproteobacteria bacterium]|nr:ABC transporter permease [Deltaproteobacteria bacterium]